MKETFFHFTTRFAYLRVSGNDNPGLQTYQKITEVKNALGDYPQLKTNDPTNVLACLFPIGTDINPFAMSVFLSPLRAKWSTLAIVCMFGCMLEKDCLRQIK